MRSADPWTMPADRLQLHAAVHEAGHALVGTHVGLELGWTTIDCLGHPECRQILDRDGWDLGINDSIPGATYFGAPIAHLVRDGLLGDRDAMCVMIAGSIAEQVICDAYLMGGYQGDLLIIDQIRAYGRKVRTPSADGEIEGLVRTDEVYDLLIAKRVDVQRVAEALVIRRTLTGDDVRLLSY